MGRCACILSRATRHHVHTHVTRHHHPFPPPQVTLHGEGTQTKLKVSSRHTSPLSLPAPRSPRAPLPRSPRSPLSPPHISRSSACSADSPRTTTRGGDHLVDGQQVGPAGVPWTPRGQHTRGQTRGGAWGQRGDYRKGGDGGAAGQDGFGRSRQITPFENIQNKGRWEGAACGGRDDVQRLVFDGERGRGLGRRCRGCVRERAWLLATHLGPAECTHALNSEADSGNKRTTVL